MESQKWFLSHDGSMATAELAHRINCWRQNVDLCSSLDSSSHFPLPCENVALNFLTRPHNSRRRKPYTRPPDSPRHRKVLQMNSDLHNVETMTFWDTRGEPEVAEMFVEDNRMSRQDSSGLDLPHWEQNPLIANHPDVLAEEFCRLTILFGKLSAERSKEELRWLHTSPKDAMNNVMVLGSNIRRVVDAAQYVIEYSQSRGWDIDFEALEYGAQPRTARVLPSRVRELVCSPDTSNNPDSNAEWHLYPAA